MSGVWGSIKVGRASQMGQAALETAQRCGGLWGAGVLSPEYKVRALDWQEGWLQTGTPGEPLGYPEQQSESAGDAGIRGEMFRGPD